MQFIEVENTIKIFFSNYRPKLDEEKIVAVYLFGSFAKQNNDENSDIDIAILFDKEPKSTLSGIGQNIASKLSLKTHKEVDLVVLNKVSADTTHHIMRHSKLIIDNNPSKRIKFEVRKRNEYFDLLPILREYRGVKKEAA